MGAFHRIMRAPGAAVVMTCFGLAAAGCGGEDDYANEPRPPEPVVVSASISGDEVSIAPQRLGAGPVTLIVANQTERTHRLTLETDEIGGSAPGIQQNSGPINPGDTASLQADLRSGTYRIAVDGRGIADARLEVGDKRASAQNELLLP